MLTAAAVVVLSLGMVSCFDNDDNSVTPSDNQQELQAKDIKQEKARKFWAVASQLVDVDDYTTDYEDLTFEPAYGVTQGTDATTRYVYTNTAAAAAERFADLVERDDIDENTESYTYSDPDVGTLAYHKGTGKILATVDVDIKQIPTLKQIVYMPGAYANAYFVGKAYYRFGDVVSRQVEGFNGKVTEYWICVRPAFGPEYKQESHWVSVSELPKNKVFSYYSESVKKHYYLPKGLGTNKEQMQNLAELLYAIYFPETWQKNIMTYANNKDKLTMFHDFDAGKLVYHNQHFWENVQKQWSEKKILEKVFGFKGTVEEFKKKLSGDEGLRLLYNGYSWWTTTSWNCSLYEAVYQNNSGDVYKERNMHKADYVTHTNNVKGFEVDCRKMGPENIAKYKQFFGGKEYTRWAVRHATGKELDKFNRWHEKVAITDVTEEYRYYKHAVPTETLNDDPEVTPEPKTPETPKE